MLSVLLRYTDSDYPFGIFKLFLLEISRIDCKCNELMDVDVLNGGSKRYIKYITQNMHKNVDIKFSVYHAFF